jgi:hypothetical protein
VGEDEEKVKFPFKNFESENEVKDQKFIQRCIQGKRGRGNSAATVRCMCALVWELILQDEGESDQDFKPVAKKRKKNEKAVVKRAAKKKAGIWLTMLPVDIMMSVAEHLPPDALFSLSFTSKGFYYSYQLSLDP